MSSDATGDVYVLQQAEFSASSGGDGDGISRMGAGVGTASGTAPGSLVTGTSTSLAVNLAPRSSRNRTGVEAICWTALAVVLTLVCGKFFAWA